jgi:hypothetical protein
MSTVRGFETVVLVPAAEGLTQHELPNCLAGGLSAEGAYLKEL